MGLLTTIHQSKLAVTALILVELAIAYGLASWAIDSGRLMVYFLTLIILVLAITDIIRLAKLLVPKTVKVMSGKR